MPKSIEMWCSACGKYVKWKPCSIKEKNGKKYSVYMHKTKHHTFVEDKDLTDLAYN